MASQDFTYELDEDRTLNEKGDIVAAAGYRFSDKQPNFNDNYDSNHQPERHTITGTMPDDKNRMIDFAIVTEILQNPKDEIESEVRGWYQNPKSASPDLDKIYGAWEDCLEDAEDYLH